MAEEAEQTTASIGAEVLGMCQTIRTTLSDFILGQ